MRMQGWDGEKAKCLSKSTGCPSAFHLLTATLLQRGLCAPLGRKGFCLKDSSKKPQKKQHKIGLQHVKKKVNTKNPSRPPDQLRSLFLISFFQFYLSTISLS